MSAKSPPQFVYKIVTENPKDFPDQFPLKGLDADDGFIHLSAAAQVPGTLDRFFMNIDKVYIIKLPYEKIASDVKWENGFPHLYGTFGKDTIESVQQFQRAQNDPWSRAAQKSQWLE